MRNSSLISKIKYLDPHQKANVIIIMVSLFLVMGLSVGYAVLSQQLNINGDVNLRVIKDIRVMSIGNFESTNSGYDIYNPSYTENSTSTFISLPNLDSTVTYTATIVNNGTDAMDVKSIISESLTNSNITYSIIGLKVGTVIASGETNTFTITYKYKTGLTEVPIDTTCKNLLRYTFGVHEETPAKEYASLSNMILDLRGVDYPTNNVWYDRINNKAMTLTDSVQYNSVDKLYEFNTNGANGTLGEPIIPITGDFTLEVRIKTNDTISSSSDEAIVSQVSDTSNNSGRIKLNLKNEQLVVFYNRQKPTSTNLTNAYTVNVSASTNYLIQLVRIDDELKLYLNGILISTNSYLSTNTVAKGPFKLAKWNNLDLQQFIGGIYSVRVYDKALSSDELINNSIVDAMLYEKSIETEHNTLNEYALNEQVVSEGDGIYLDNLGRYVYRGENPNNYVRLSGSTKLFRILYFDVDGDAKLLDISSKINIAYDSSGNRSFNEFDGEGNPNLLRSTYCTYASTSPAGLTEFYGCNAWYAASSYNNLNTTGSVNNDSSSNTYLNTTYYNSLDDIVKSRLIIHPFAVGTGKNSLYRDQQNTQSMSDTWTGKVGLLSSADVLNASINSVKIANGKATVNNFINLSFEPNEFIWTMTNGSENTYDEYTISEKGALGQKKSSRTNQVSGSITYTMYAVPAIYVDTNSPFIGAGTHSNPFVLE